MNGFEKCNCEEFDSRRGQSFLASLFSQYPCMSDWLAVLEVSPEGFDELDQNGGHSDTIRIQLDQWRTGGRQRVEWPEWVRLRFCAEDAGALKLAIDDLIAMEVCAEVVVVMRLLESNNGCFLFRETGRGDLWVFSSKELKVAKFTKLLEREESAQKKQSWRRRFAAFFMRHAS